MSADDDTATSVDVPEQHTPEKTKKHLPLWQETLLLLTIAIVLAIPVFITYLNEGIVPRLPTAILSTGLILLASLSISAGLILDTVTRGRRELKLLAYLNQRAPNSRERESDKR